MIFGQYGFVPRPNRLESVKDKKYHANYARYCLSGMNSVLYQKYVRKCAINWSFYKGGDGQWIFDEDVESFFLDESGDFKNRLKWTKNILKPMVNQYVGNAIRLSYDASLQCISDFVINKREDEMARRAVLHRLAQKDPIAKEIISDRVPIGDTEIETQEIFKNTFVETYEEDMNNLLEYISTSVDINDLKVNISRNLALCGMGIYKGYYDRRDYQANAVNPMFFFWDMSAIKQDLTDAEYMGEWYYMDAASIQEKYNLSIDERKAVEKYATDKNHVMQRIINNVRVVPGGKIPVYEVYWKDTEKQEYGYVMDEFGYPYYTQINSKDSIYTDKDLIEPISEKDKLEMGKSKKHTVYVDLMRYCIFIPKEELNTNGDDIILDFGIAEYQEKQLSNPANVKFPYKCYTWVYDRGEVLTPLDDAIDPQRFLNRTLSVVESQMSNMRGTGTVVSKSAVDERDGEFEVARAINASKPIFVDTDRVGSVQNAIGTYGTNIGAGTLQMFEVINTIQQSIQDVTGVNEAMTGTQGGSDTLVGVVEAQIQRGSLVQEPFYYSLTKVLEQAYDHMATVGKMVYIDNPRRLAISVGDKGAKTINLTKDHLNQDYRCFIKRGETREQGIAAGNQLLFTLLQGQLIDDKIFADLFNRANPERIANALRDYAREKQQAQINMDKVNAQRNEQQDQAQQQAIQLMAEGNQAERMQKQQDNQLAHEQKLDEIALEKGMELQAKNAQAQPENQGMV